MGSRTEAHVCKEREGSLQEGFMRETQKQHTEKSCHSGLGLLTTASRPYNSNRVCCLKVTVYGSQGGHQKEKRARLEAACLAAGNAEQGCGRRSGCFSKGCTQSPRELVPSLRGVSPTHGPQGQRRVHRCPPQRYSQGPEAGNKDIAHREKNREETKRSPCGQATQLLKSDSPETRGDNSILL